jgi:hypothetical protein
MRLCRHEKKIYAAVRAQFFFLCLSARSAQLSVGDAMPKIIANDQHGVAFQFTNGIRCLLVVTEMAASKTANQKLAAVGAGFLSASGQNQPVESE